MDESKPRTRYKDRVQRNDRRKYGNSALHPAARSSFATARATRNSSSLGQRRWPGNFFTVKIKFSARSNGDDPRGTVYVGTWPQVMQVQPQAGVIDTPLSSSNVSPHFHPTFWLPRAGSALPCYRVCDRQETSAWKEVTRHQ